MGRILLLLGPQGNTTNPPRLISAPAGLCAWCPPAPSHALHRKTASFSYVVKLWELCSCRPQEKVLTIPSPRSSGLRSAATVLSPAAEAGELSPVVSSLSLAALRQRRPSAPESTRSCGCFSLFPVLRLAPEGWQPRCFLLAAGR